jgi:hypothetical protein
MLVVVVVAIEQRDHLMVVLEVEVLEDIQELEME